MAPRHGRLRRLGLELAQAAQLRGGVLRFCSPLDYATVLRRTVLGDGRQG